MMHQKYPMHSDNIQMFLEEIYKILAVLAKAKPVTVSFLNQIFENQVYRINPHFQ